jgi:hypothetical protein
LRNNGPIDAAGTTGLPRSFGWTEHDDVVAVLGEVPAGLLGKPDPDPGVSEADDVGTTVAVQVGEEARVHVNTPPSGVMAEVSDDQLWPLKGTVAIVTRDPDSGISKAHHVGTAIAGEVGEEAWMLVDTPPSGVISEVRHHHLWRLKSAFAVVARDPHSGVSEAHDVGTAIAEVGEEAWMPVNTPAPGVISEVLDHHLWRLKGAVAVVEGDPHSGVSEAHNVGTAIAVRSARKRGCWSTRHPPAL